MKTTRSNNFPASLNFSSPSVVKRTSKERASALGPQKHRSPGQRGAKVGEQTEEEEGGKGSELSNPSSSGQTQVQGLLGQAFVFSRLLSDRGGNGICRRHHPLEKKLFPFRVRANSLDLQPLVSTDPDENPGELKREREREGGRDDNASR